MELRQLLSSSFVALQSSGLSFGAPPRHCLHAGTLSSYAFSGGTSRSCGGSDSLLANPRPAGDVGRGCATLRLTTTLNNGVVDSAMQISVVTQMLAFAPSPIPLGGALCFILSNDQKALQPWIPAREHVLYASAFDSRACHPTNTKHYDTRAELFRKRQLGTRLPGRVGGRALSQVAKLANMQQICKDTAATAAQSAVQCRRGKR